MRNLTASSSATAPSEWRSPVPFLLGGVGCMIALISFALFILACSYVKESYSSNSNSEENSRSEQSRESDVVYGDKNETMANRMPRESSEEEEEKIVVIMAGDVTPSFIANPSPVSAI